MPIRGCCRNVIPAAGAEEVRINQRARYALLDAAEGLVDKPVNDGLCAESSP